MSQSPVRPLNAEEQAMCIIRYMVNLPGGEWLGAWDRSSFDTYIAQAVAAERERCAKLCEQWNATNPQRLAQLIREGA